MILERLERGEALLELGSIHGLEQLQRVAEAFAQKPELVHLMMGRLRGRGCVSRTEQFARELGQSIAGVFGHRTIRGPGRTLGARLVDLEILHPPAVALLLFPTFEISNQSPLGFQADTPQFLLDAVAGNLFEQFQGDIAIARGGTAVHELT